MKYIEAFLTPDSVTVGNETQSKRVAVVIDILRATTVMLTALYIGMESVVPVKGLEEGYLLKLHYPDWVLAGEVGGLKPEGYEYGNSPVEITEAAATLQGKTLVLNTTNGTPLLSKLVDDLSLEKDRILIGAFTNLSALTQHIVQEDPEFVYFCCSGRRGRVSFEDTLAAGFMVETLVKAWGSTPVTIGDGGQVARTLARAYSDAPGIIPKTSHGQDLHRLGFEKDLSFSATINKTPVVGGYTRGAIRKVAG